MPAGAEGSGEADGGPLDAELPVRDSACRFFNS